MTIRNEVLSQMAEITGSLDAAQCSEALRAYYDLRLRHLKADPIAVAEFDADELARAEERAQDAGS